MIDDPFRAPEHDLPSPAAHRLHLLLATLLTIVVLLALLFSVEKLAHAADAQDSGALPQGATALPQGVAIYFTSNLTATTTSQAVTGLEAALLAALNGATSSIDAALYDFDRASVRDALIAAHNRGVTVRVVGDNDARVSEKSRASFDLLQAAGIPMVFDGAVAADLPDSAPVTGDPEEEVDPAALAEMATSRIMHDKYFILDGQRLWTGSVNMSDTEITLNHNHGMLFDSAPLAALYQHDFDQMFAGVFGNQKVASPTTSLTIDGMATTAVFAPQDDPIDAIVAEIDGAQTTIDFAIFFFTNDKVRDAMLRAYARGVRIRGLWDNLGAKDGSSDDEALCAAGLAIKIENTRGVMHHKLLVIDAGGADARVVAGSLNWTAGGNDFNNENTLILRNGAVAAAFQQAFDTLWNGIAVTPCNPEGQTPSLHVYLPLIEGPPTGPPPPAPTVTPPPTLTPAVTPTPQPAAGDVEIVRVVYDPPGADVENERVTLANRTAAAITLTNWTLHDDAANANRFTFPAFTLAAGAQVTVWVKTGENSGSELYWGRTQAVWNNDGDVAYLRTATGFAVDACAFEGGATESDCQ